MRRVETVEPCEWCEEHFAALLDGEWVCLACEQAGWGECGPTDKWGGPPKPENSESAPGNWWDTQ